MRMLSLLRRNESGAAAIEMALALPILVSMIYGLFQVGLLYQANAGMQHALGEGARVATLYERFTTNNVPTDTAIKSRMTSKLFGRGDGTFTVADPVTGTGYKDLSITYSKRMNFIFFSGPTITLTRSKRAYTVS
jgi:Flp pilus assembly protein TadG